jgi:hypothetical protein
MWLSDAQFQQGSQVIYTFSLPHLIMREEFLEQTVSNKPQLLCSLCVIYIAIPVEQSLDSFPSTLSADGEGTSIIRSMLFMACI